MTNKPPREENLHFELKLQFIAFIPWILLALILSVVIFIASNSNLAEHSSLKNFLVFSIIFVVKQNVVLKLNLNNKLIIN